MDKHAKVPNSNVTFLNAYTYPIRELNYFLLQPPYNNWPIHLKAIRSLQFPILLFSENIFTF